MTACREDGSRVNSPWPRRPLSRGPPGTVRSALGPVNSHPIRSPSILAPGSVLRLMETTLATAALRQNRGIRYATAVSGRSWYAGAVRRRYFEISLEAC